MKHLFVFSLAALWLTVSVGQEKTYVSCIAFYNLENLFDTLDQDTHNDEDFTPDGSYGYTPEIYKTKLRMLSEVISEIGTEINPDGPALLGVSEIENRSVLEDLVRQEAIANRDYKIIHYQSKDHRGIDVALLYQEKYFRPRKSFTHSLITRISDTDTSYSRDILFVIGSLAGEDIVISVNHWPSRRGGAKATAHLRNAAAKVNDRILDSLSEHHGLTKHIIIGDLNDDPNNDSVEKYLSAKGKRKKVKEADRYNPMCRYYKKGYGTTAWRDAWSLFDQIIFSSAWLDDEDGFQYYQAKVFNPKYMLQKTGQFKGYPLRTFAGGQYLGGYSDHFPVYAYLVKKVNE